MPRKPTKSTKRATATKPTKQAKPPGPTEPPKPPRQTAEVTAAIYYFGTFGIHNNAISELILSKYPRAVYVHAEDCRDRLVWFRDVYLPRRGLSLTKTIVGEEVQKVVPLLETFNFITQIDDGCENILQRAKGKF